MRRGDRCTTVIWQLPTTDNYTLALVPLVLVDDGETQPGRAPRSGVVCLAGAIPRTTGQHVHNRVQSLAGGLQLSHHRGAMSTETPAQLTQIQPSPPKKSQHRVLKVVGAVVAAGALIGIGAAIGSSGNSTKTVTVPRPTITQTVPGPNVTQQVTVSPPPAATGTTIATFRGSGNDNTGSFNVPDSGNYLVAWSYRRNNECSLGSCQAANFSISETGSGLGGDLPNDIAASGHGSTEVTGASGTDRFNVQAVGSWTITVKAA